MSVDKKKRILELFFNEHLNQVEIAKIVGVKKQYVSRILKSDSRYAEAKANKLEESAIKRKEYQKSYKRTKQIDNSYEQLQEQLKQDSLELSYYNGGISDYDFAKWNLSAYHRNKKGNLAINKGLIVGFDVPKTINMNIKIPTQKYPKSCYSM